VGELFGEGFIDKRGAGGEVPVKGGRADAGPAGAPGGRMVAIAFDVENVLASLSYVLASTVHGSRRVRFFSGNPRHELFAELTRYAENGDLRPVVDTVHPLADIAAAHRALEAGGVRGKHIIQIV
jgi:NADPH:quinone reductase-like Zn-dependent oxidoreductase